LIRPVEAAKIPDNSSDFQHLTYSYQGLDEVKGILADGKPMVFITWHQGAGGRNYGMAQVLPETAFFTRKTFQYGRVFSYSMLGAKSLSLLKMERFLREGRPVKYSIDGAPLGNTIRSSILGIPADLSTAPIRIMKSVKGLQVIPVTAYYRKGYALEIIFHPPFPPSVELPKMSDREVLEALLSYLERDLITQAPEQVRWRFIGNREHLAKQI
jgi:lauroyl/myristoyl acyltransferase